MSVHLGKDSGVCFVTIRYGHIGSAEYGLMRELVLGLLLS